MRNLTKRYRAYGGAWQRLRGALFPDQPLNGAREFVALDDVSLSLARGSALGVIGANGAGKSTLLKILAGIIEPTSGEVRMHGKVASIIELGAGFHPDFTGRQNVFLNNAINGLSEDHAAESFEQIAQFSELGKYLDMPVRTYSSGMFVRLAFAVAVSARPEILLIDEALAVGDAVFAHRCLSRIREMRERGVTIVFVSHDTNTVAGLCDRAILLEQGRITSDGEARDVIHSYLLRVAERLTTLDDGGSDPATFHEVGAHDVSEAGTERRFGSFQAKIEDIRIEDEDGNEAAKLASGKIARFKIRLKFNRDVENPVIGIMFKNRFGVEIFGTNTKLRKLDSGTYRAGDTAEAIFELPLLIGDGIYTVSFAIHTAEGHFFDYRVDARVFEVLGGFDNIGIASLPTTIATRKL